MSEQGSIPALLYISSSRDSFEIWLCMSKVVKNIPSTNLFYAANAEDGLKQLNQRKIDIIVLDIEPEQYEMHDILFNSYVDGWPAIIVHSSTKINNCVNKPRVYYLGPCETLDGVHKSLLVAHSIFNKKVNVTVESIETH